jgi:hypothetical protein
MILVTKLTASDATDRFGFMILKLPRGAGRTWRVAMRHMKPTIRIN